MLFLIIIPNLCLGYRSLNLTADLASLSGDSLIMLSENNLSLYNLSTKTQENIHQNITSFQSQSSQMIAWNEKELYYFKDLKLVSTLENKNSSNFSIVGSNILTFLNAEAILINPLEKTNISLKETSINNITSYSLEGDQLTYIAADRQFHQIKSECLEEKIWLAEKQGKFNAVIWSNGTANFMGHFIEFRFPSKNLFWYHQDSLLRMKFLFQVQDAYVFALYTNKAICYQYYRTNNTIHYQNILCMKVETEDFVIESINYQYRIQILLKNTGNELNTLHLDTYSQCILYQSMPEGYNCNMCQLGEYCMNECHKLKQNKCVADLYYIRGSLPFVMVCICFGLMLGSAIVSFLKALKESWQFIILLFGIVLKFFCCTIPKKLIRIIKRISLKWKRRLQLPIQNGDVCPICLDEVIEAKYFTCNRHSACEECYNQYQKTFPGRRVMCPFRD